MAARDTVDRIRQRTGIIGRLMAKVDEPLLWMEVYDEIADAAVFLDTMRDCVERSAISRWLDGDHRRHTEIFRSTPLRQDPTPGDVS